MERDKQREKERKKIMNQSSATFENLKVIFLNFLLKSPESHKIGYVNKYIITS